MATDNSLRRLATHCEDWRAHVMTCLRAEPPRLVVVSMWRLYGAGRGWLHGFTAYDEAWNDGLTHLVRALPSIGAAVLVLGPAPDPHSVVPVRLPSTSTTRRHARFRGRAR